MSELEIATSHMVKAIGDRRFRGPVSAKIWSKAKRIGGDYADKFDYGVYDRLYERFGPNQPRGGVIFKTGLKLVNFHSSCSRCHYALEIDTYGRGCIHNCTYCYAKETLTQHGYWNQPVPFPADISEIRKVFHQVFETDRATKWRSVLEQRIPVRIGSMSDSFMHIDKRYRVSQELLKILRFYSYPYVIFTRSDLLAEGKRNANRRLYLAV